MDSPADKASNETGGFLVANHLPDSPPQNPLQRVEIPIPTALSTNGEIWVLATPTREDTSAIS